MKKVIFLFIFTILFIGGMVGYKLMNTNAIADVVDSSKVDHTIRIGVDNWAGYFYLCSNQLRKLGLDSRILIQCEDDGADFATRTEKLHRGDLEFAAFTVDSYVKNGKSFDYPASFISVIDESQGGDAIFVNKGMVSNVDDLKSLSANLANQADKSIRIAYTTDSPSEMLVTAWKRDFGVDIDNKSMFSHLGTNGSSDAYSKLDKAEADIAVLWQPDVAKAEADPRFVKLLGSNETKNLIVDTLVVQNQFMLKSPDLVERFMKLYYETMDFYDSNETVFNKELASYTGISQDFQLEALKDGIKWVDLVENGTDWLGFSYNAQTGNRQLFDSINMVTRIMEHDKQIGKNTLPNNDAFRLINSNVTNSVFEQGKAGNLNIAFVLPTIVENMGIGREFKKLSPGKWNKLRTSKTVGSVNLDPIGFRTGSDDLFPIADEQMAFNRLAEILVTYPRYRVIIEGHTGNGDSEANMALSKKRAEAVKSVLINNIGVHKDRIYTIGYGDSNPPARMVDESKRAWWKRWARVNIVLVQD